jgi:hypothetical protein
MNQPLSRIYEWVLILFLSGIKITKRPGLRLISHHFAQSSPLLA